MIEPSNASPRLFDDGCGDAGCGGAYIACRDHSGKRKTRDELEAAWEQWGHLCPEGPVQFPREFRRDFHARAWELWLIAVLSKAGFKLECAPARGPDLLVRLPSGLRCWIEAVVPRPGDGDDAVFQRPPGPWCGALYPAAKAILRYRSALEDKLAKIEGYIKDGIVTDDDAVLIAVCQGAILDSDLHDNEVPLLAKAVLPIGETVVVVTPYSKSPHRIEVPRRDAVVKASGASVSTTLFLEPRSASISGLVFVGESVWNLPWAAGEVLGMRHNPMARTPLPKATLPLRCELWVEGETLRHTGRCARVGVYSQGEPT